MTVSSPQPNDLLERLRGLTLGLHFVEYDYDNYNARTHFMPADQLCENQSPRNFRFFHDFFAISRDFFDFVRVSSPQPDEFFERLWGVIVGFEFIEYD